MLFITTYTLKSHMSGDEVKGLMDAFGEVGPGPGTIAHYVNVDGSGGVVIADNDDPAGSYRNLLNYRPWIDFETKPVLAIDDAVPQILDLLS